MGTWPAAAAASTWTRTPRVRQAATISATGCNVPTSWLAHCTCTNAVEPGWMAATTSSGSTRPIRSTPTVVTSKRADASRTAECSTAGTTMRPPRSPAPQTAAAMASVAPLVNTTSRDRAPNRAATRSRASSTTARAILPSVCTRPGSAAPDNHGSMASTASGRAGEVEAWSR